MTTRVLEQLPLELVNMIARHWTYEQCTAYSEDMPPIRHLVGSQVYWHNRVLRITNRNQLGGILRDGATRNATTVDLRGAGIDDTDLHFISYHFYKIQRLYLGHNPDVTDDGVRELLQIHGSHLIKLHLDKLFRLTNVTLECLQLHCRSLRNLSLAGGMFTSAPVRQMLMDATFQLEGISLSRCYLLDTRELLACCANLQKLCILDLSHLDALQPYQVQAVVRECPRLKHLNITGCHEFTLKAVKELSILNANLHIEHDARLEDHSIEGVRRFLLGLVQAS